MMHKDIIFILYCIAVVFLIGAIVQPAHADPLAETRYCGAPLRNADGSIHRRADVLAAFQKIHPCPSTGLRSGACPGWALDHVVSLDCGGCDSVSNLQWLPVSLKTCAGICKDRWERKVYAATPPFPDTKGCVNQIVK